MAAKKVRMWMQKWREKREVSSGCVERLGTISATSLWADQQFRRGAAERWKSWCEDKNSTGLF